MNLDALIKTAVSKHVLDPERHNNLMRHAPQIAARANIAPHWLFTSAKGVVTDAEFEFMSGYYGHAANGTSGLMIATDKPVRPIFDRFSALAAWAIRNGLTARVFPLQTVFDLLHDGGMPEPDLLLIPDFLTEAMTTKKTDMPAWVSTRMTGLIHSRQATGQQTVVYVQLGLAHAFPVLAKFYGLLVSQHIEAHYDKGIE